MNQVSCYYIGSYLLECMEPYKSAYAPLQYAAEIEDDLDFYGSFEEDSSINPLDYIYKRNIELWKYRTMQRYGSCIKRIIDYIIFGLSWNHIIPDIGFLYLCQEVKRPYWSNYYQIACCYDEKYPEFCRRYMTQLFLMAGWSLEVWKEDDFLRKGSSLIAERYYAEEYDDVGFWQQEVLSDGNEDCTFYVFTTKDDYSRSEIRSIFEGFCESGVTYILDNKSVLVSVPKCGECNGLEIAYNWAEFCPLSALTAWVVKCKKDLFGRVTLEVRYDR